MANVAVKRRLSLVIFLLCFIVVANISHATTIEESLKHALSHNPDIALEKSRLEKEQANKGDIFVEFLPEVKASMQRGRQQNDALGLDRGDLDKINDRDVRQIDLVQPVFNGFQSYNKAKEINSNIKSAEEYYKNRRNEILIEALTSYLNLYKFRTISSLKTENLTNSKELLRLIKQRNKLGEVGGNEVISYQTKLSNNISEELTAKTEKFKAEEEYNKIIGRVDENLELADNKAEKNEFGNIETLKDIAINNNPALKQYKFKIDSARSSINQAKGSFLPTVDITAQIQDQENVTYLNNRDLRSKSIYLNVSVPLFQKGSEYVGLSKSKRELNFAKKEYEANKQNLLKEVKQTHKEYLFYKDLVTHTKELVQLNQDRIDKLTEQVETGEGDIVDLLNAKLELNSSKEQNIINHTNYLLSYYKLLIFTDKLQL